jgi:hypothetical protein
VARGATIDAKYLAEMSLWVEIHKQYTEALVTRKVVPDVRRQGRLAATAFLVDEGDLTAND